MNVEIVFKNISLLYQEYAKRHCHCILNFLKLLHKKKFLGVSWFTSSYSCLWGKTVDWQTKFSAVQFDHYPMLWLSLILNGIALYRLYMKSNLHTNLWHKLHRTPQLPLHTWLAILTPFCIQSEIDFTYNLQIFLFHMHILYTWELPGYASSGMTSGPKHSSSN